MLGIRAEPIRVVIVDDSATARELLVGLLAAEGMRVVGTGANGAEAVQLAARFQPDVITMDVNMARMDGLEATRRIMQTAPTRIVIVTASIMRADMDLTFEALQAGALTVVRKPGLNDPQICAELIEAIRLMADVPVVHRWSRETAARAVPRVSPPRQAGAAGSRQLYMPDIIGIAASTGGPATLVKLLRLLPADLPAPLLIVQHITNGFIAGLAEWLDRETALAVKVAGHGETPQRGSVLLAPDDYHMRVNMHGVVELCREPPYRGQRPSANYLFHSLARAYGPRALGIVLTGMGDDGAEGLAALRAADGLTMAQDEDSSVVYGMPGEALARGGVDWVLPPEQIAWRISQLVHS